MPVAKPITKPFLSFSELCSHLNCTPKQLHGYIAGCQIAPSIRSNKPFVELEAHYLAGQDRPKFRPRPHKLPPAERLLSKQYDISYGQHKYFHSTELLYALYPEYTGAITYQFSAASPNAYGHTSPTESALYGQFSENGNLTTFNQDYIEHNAVFLSTEIQRFETAHHHASLYTPNDTISVQEHDLLHTLIGIAQVIFKDFSPDEPYAAARMILNETGLSVSDETVAKYLRKHKSFPSSNTKIKDVTKDTYCHLIYSMAASIPGFNSKEIKKSALKVCNEYDLPISNEQFEKFLLTGQKIDKVVKHPS